MENIEEKLVKEEKFIQPLLEVVRDKRGLKHAMKYSKEYILNFLIEREVLSCHRNVLINELRKYTNYQTTEIMELVNSYFKWKVAFPTNTLQQNLQLDEASERYGTQFEKVGNKILGVVNRDNRNLVIDVSGVNEMVLAEINNGGINWRNNEITTPEMRWVIDTTKKRMGVSL